MSQLYHHGRATQELRMLEASSGSDARGSHEIMFYLHAERCRQACEPAVHCVNCALREPCDRHHLEPHRRIF